jgi:hypothetical protein
MKLDKRSLVPFLSTTTKIEQDYGCVSQEISRQTTDPDFNSTVAPAASKFFFTFSASATEIASLLFFLSCRLQNNMKFCFPP